jgi:hypothetical protein
MEKSRVLETYSENYCKSTVSGQTNLTLKLQEKHGFDKKYFA